MAWYPSQTWLRIAQVIDQQDHAAGHKQGRYRSPHDLVYIKPQYKIKARGQGSGGTAQCGNKEQLTRHVTAVILRLHQQPHRIGRDHAQDADRHKIHDDAGKQGAITRIFNIQENRAHGQICEQDDGQAEQCRANEKQAEGSAIGIARRQAPAKQVTHSQGEHKNRDDAAPHHLTAAKIRRHDARAQHLNGHDAEAADEGHADDEQRRKPAGYSPFFTTHKLPALSVKDR